MKKITLLFFCLMMIKIKSQTTNWTKDDRNNIYSDCMSYSTKYKNLSSEQKESICLCYLEETTKKYIKTDFESKIDIEIKRIKDATLIQCAKNIGLELNTQSKEEVVNVELKEKPNPLTTTTIISKTILIGKWKTDDISTIEFKDDGTYFEKRGDNPLTSNNGYIVDGILKGDWFLDDKGTLTIRKEWTEDVGIFSTKIRNYTTAFIYKFDSFTIDFLKFTRENDGLTIQANRIK